MSDRETALPANRGNRRYYWLRSERLSRLCICEWLNGQWYSAGDTRAISPAEMFRRGWKWHSACYVPDGEATAGLTVEQASEELLRRRIEAACRRMAFESGVDPDAQAISPIGSEPVHGPMKIILVHKTEPAWHAFAVLAQAALQEGGDE